MPTVPVAVPGYRQRLASNQLKEIVEDSMEELFRIRGDLCRVAYASTRDFMRSRASLFARQGKAVPAMVASPQSFGDLLIPHLHLWCRSG